MNFDIILRGREFFSTMYLVRAGLFPHRSAIWKLVREKKLEIFCTSKKARVVPRDSLIRYLKAINKEKGND